jgi:hypothetical protein
MLRFKSSTHFKNPTELLSKLSTLRIKPSTLRGKASMLQQGSSMRCPEKRAIGKYNVSRRIDDSALAEQVTPVKLLAA